MPLANKQKIIQSKSCDGKVRHKSRTAAEYVLSGMKLSNDKNRPLEIYYCTFCKNYHIGHGPKPKTNKLPSPLGEGIGGEAK